MASTSENPSRVTPTIGGGGDGGGGGGEPGGVGGDGGGNVMQLKRYVLPSVSPRVVISPSVIGQLLAQEDWRSHV